MIKRCYETSTSFVWKVGDGQETRRTEGRRQGQRARSDKRIECGPGHMILRTESELPLI